MAKAAHIYIFIVMITLFLTGCATQKRPTTVLESEVITIDATVLFDFDKSDIREDAKAILDDIANKMSGNQRVRIIVEGHTDTIGSAEYNEILAEKRARSVGSYLTQQGVDYRRLTFISKGESDPAEAGRTKAANRKNRRVELYK